ncbi:MAG: cation-transporting P-type ATPase, partial [Nanoarchaeota archaeon]
MTDWYRTAVPELYTTLDSGQKGLDERQAEDRLKKYGENITVKDLRVSVMRIFARQFNSVIIYILLAAAIISLFV